MARYSGNRQYSERHTVLSNVNDILDLIAENSEGVFEFRPQVYNQFNRFFISYFSNRKDDDLSVVGREVSKDKVEINVSESEVSKTSDVPGFKVSKPVKSQEKKIVTS